MTLSRIDEELSSDETEETQPLLYPEKKWSSVSNELSIVLLNAMPLTVTFLLQGSIPSMPLLFVGRLDALQLGGVAIANVTFTVSVAVFLGLTTSLDTLCPQAFGARQYKLVGLYLQRCVILAFAIAIPMILAWVYSGCILIHFIDNPEIVKIASSYLRLMTFSLPGFIIFECGKRYFQSMNNFTKGQYILFICAPFNAVLGYVMILRFQLGYVGACCSLIFTYNLMGLIMAISIYFCHIDMKRNTPDLDCWHEVSSKVFDGWSTMIELSLPGIIMVESEFFAFEFTSILAARFGTTVLAAQSIASTVESLTFQIPFSVGVAASNRIAFHIGQGNIRNCKTAVGCTLVYIGTVLCLLNFSLLTFGRYVIAKLFTSDPEVISSTVPLISIIAVNQFWDIFNVFGAACLRAQGRQRIGGCFSLIAYYVIGLPLGVYLGFKKHLGARGFWIGIGTGIFFLSITELMCVYRSNWTKILQTAKKMHNY
ncbi:hypothetical protein HG535_0C01740 [Zygotorulaspora mrakii]|uniref:MATE efflux family protein n=1 Tax=Zygotorulaspora mrakii TaxID=42260 RepID=A0A7H9AZG9_ZYGMR|nr:uncharacterized protein HG535_0C01740 [Zygotorulaspora mrakii]QLG71825.1 hypothetical protein HG535_0C01740 [Zygotorulaspora mrakii]